jgi:CelD/BcsL family acetyltransferase involved in cellulose biosynthesis
VELHASPEELSDRWEALADRLTASPFLRAGWLGAWSRAFAPNRLRALTATRDGQTVGLFPFLERRGVVAAPVNWHTPVFGILAADPEVRAALAGALISRARVRTDLSMLDREDPTLAELHATARRTRRPVVVRPVLHSPYVSLADTDWESYRASLDRKARKDVERRRRRLDERGSVSADFEDGRTDLQRLLAEGLRLEGSGWKHARKSAITSQPVTHRFYSEIATWAGERGLLLLAFLRADGRPIAFDLCLESGSVTYVLKGGFDPEFRGFAPGMLLTYASLQRAFAQGLSSYELLGDDSRYKLVWTQAKRERMRFQAFSRSPRGRANHLAWTHGRASVLRVLHGVRRTDPRRASSR